VRVREARAQPSVGPDSSDRGAALRDYLFEKAGTGVTQTLQGMD
jgi:hypothetical protein